MTDHQPTRRQLLAATGAGTLGTVALGGVVVSAGQVGQANSGDSASKRTANEQARTDESGADQPTEGQSTDLDGRPTDEEKVIPVCRGGDADLSDDEFPHDDQSDGHDVDNDRDSDIIYVEVPCPDGEPIQPELMDLDNDGKTEILIQDCDLDVGEFSISSTDPRDVEIYRVGVDCVEGQTSPKQFDDIDGDEKPEIVVHTCELDPGEIEKGGAPGSNVVDVVWVGVECQNGQPINR